MGKVQIDSPRPLPHVAAAMPALRVLFAPDKFKGTLTAQAAAQAMARGWRAARPGDRVQLLPIADGGDGFGEVLGRSLQARMRVTQTLDAAHRPVAAAWWWHARTRTAVVEAARVIGLAMLPRGQYHPFALDTFGLGLLLEAVRKAGARRLLVGIGGSATNDGGFGMARALGWQFLARDGSPIQNWCDLGQLAEARPPRRRQWFADVRVAVDVQNRLLGPRGASRVYGPQKGLRPEDFRRAEACLRRLAQTLKELRGEDFATWPGAGAAGGLGFGFPAFLGARLEPGFELLARQVDLPRRLAWADLVVTGEGQLDASTLMGKGVGQLAQRCRQAGLPCLALAGTIADLPKRQRLFHTARALTELVDAPRAQTEAAAWLERLARETAACLTAATGA